MIVTTPGSPAKRRAARRAPRLAAAVIAISAILTGVIPAVAVAAPTPDPTPPIATGTLTLTLSPVSNGIVRPGEPLNASVTLDNGTQTATAAAEVTLSIGASALPDRRALSAWLGGDTSGVTVSPVGTGVLDTVTAGSDRVTGITVAGDAPGVAGRAPGVYPIVATATVGDTVLSSTSAMIVPRDDGTEVGIGVLVPITAGPLTEGMLTGEQLAELTAPGGGLSSQLDAVEGTDAILAVDPAVPASIRVLGAAAPASATAWLARLEGLPNSRFALQYGDADVAAQLQAGLPRLLEPESLAAFAESAGPPATPTAAATPAPTPAPTTDVLDTEELLSIGGMPRADVFWPADGTAGPDVVAQLGELSTGGTGSLTVVPSTSTSDGAAGDTVAARAHAGAAELLVYDAAVSDALAQASRLERPSLRGAPLTAATAHLAFAAADTDGPLLVSLGRDADRSRVSIATAIATATTAPGLSPRALASVAAGASASTEIVDVEIDPARPAAATALVAEESEIDRFATILDDPTLLTGPERAELLQLLGASWVGDGTWANAVAEHRAQTQTTLGSVGLLPVSSNELYGASAALRFWVRNDLEYPVNLVLYTTPDNLRLDVQRETMVRATPSSNTRIEVPVQARVGRGEVTLTLELRSPASVPIGTVESVDVNVWADWEGFGIGALAVVVGGLLVVGVVRTVLRMRRRKGERDAARGSRLAAAGEDTP
jgi:hypothetical protein